jgi:hypothetical protein
MHWLHLCLGVDFVVQEPRAELHRILQALVFECFQDVIREEETLSWKIPEA